MEAPSPSPVAPSACPNCGHPRARHASDNDPCPQCGAIYWKAEAHRREREQEARAAAGDRLEPFAVRSTAMLQMERILAWTAAIAIATGLWTLLHPLFGPDPGDYPSDWPAIDGPPFWRAYSQDCPTLDGHYDISQEPGGTEPLPTAGRGTLPAHAALDLRHALDDARYTLSLAGDAARGTLEVTYTRADIDSDEVRSGRSRWLRGNGWRPQIYYRCHGGWLIVTKQDALGPGEVRFARDKAGNLVAHERRVVDASFSYREYRIWERKTVAERWGHWPQTAAPPPLSEDDD